MTDIRRVRPEEWRELRALRLEALLDSPDVFWTRHEEAIERSDDEWRRWTALPCHVAVEEGCLVGMVAASPDPRDPANASLLAVYVTPASRGRGVGAALVSAQLAWARAEGFARMSLMVTVDNSAAWRLYERLGFRDTGERVPLRGGPQVVAAMTRELPGHGE